MIPVKELRIGNFVGLNLEEFPDNYFTVLEVAESSSVFTSGLDCHHNNTRDYFDPSDVEPIPLTEGWLIRFWFRIFKDEFISPSDFYWVHDKFPGSIGNIRWEYHPHKTAPIKYVHQLQNLYFALTGKELTIKP